MIKIKLLVLVPYAIFKLIRQSFLEKEGYESFKLFLLSFPNLAEGIIGVLLLTGIGIYLNKRSKINNKIVYFFASVLAMIYVVTQELNIHNLGGKNTYDPNDLMYSFIGLLIGTITVFILSPKVKLKPSNI